MRFIDKTIQCPFCSRTYDNPVYNEDVSVKDREEYLKGAKNIMYIFGNRSATFRETLISGICPECQSKFFK